MRVLFSEESVGRLFANRTSLFVAHVLCAGPVVDGAAVLFCLFLLAGTDAISLLHWQWASHQACEICSVAPCLSPEMAYELQTRVHLHLHRALCAPTRCLCCRFQCRCSNVLFFSAEIRTAVIQVTNSHTDTHGRAHHVFCCCFKLFAVDVLFCQAASWKMLFMQSVYGRAPFLGTGTPATTQGCERT